MRVVLCNHNPTPADKQEAVVKRLAEHLGLKTEDVLVLPAGYSVSLFDVNVSHAGHAGAGAHAGHPSQASHTGAKK